MISTSQLELNRGPRNRLWLWYLWSVGRLLGGGKWVLFFSVPNDIGRCNSHSPPICRENRADMLFKGWSIGKRWRENNALTARNVIQHRATLWHLTKCCSSFVFQLQFQGRRIVLYPPGYYFSTMASSTNFRTDQMLLYEKLKKKQYSLSISIMSSNHYCNQALSLAIHFVALPITQTIYYTL